MKMVSPMLGMKIPEVATSQLRSVWPKVKNPDGCWIWTGAIRAGYGEIGIKGRTYRAHRVFFELFKYKIPEGLTIDHLCNNKLCVNPDHLEAATQKHNVGRALKRAYCWLGLVPGLGEGWH